jgi:cyclopropane fatty-acyl-phospholipid synthase-like methyltransferase
MLIQKYLDNFFKGIDLTDKSVLDIGCGDGRLGMYCLKRNARYVVGLEPTYKGHWSTDKKPLDIKTIRFQDYKDEGRFDLIVLHDSINHLNELACINLDKSVWAWGEYQDIAKKLYALLNQGGKLVIADASQRNLWGDLHLPSPFDGTIEWHKHQTPKVWIELLSSCGFVNSRIKWITPSRLLRLNLLCGNKIASYFMVSHFRLVVEKNG